MVAGRPVACKLSVHDRHPRRRLVDPQSSERVDRRGRAARAPGPPRSDDQPPRVDPHQRVELRGRRGGRRSGSTPTATPGSSPPTWRSGCDGFRRPPTSTPGPPCCEPGGARSRARCGWSTMPANRSVTACWGSARVRTQAERSAQGAGRRRPDRRALGRHPPDRDPTARGSGDPRARRTAGASSRSTPTRCSTTRPA